MRSLAALAGAAVILLSACAEQRVPEALIHVWRTRTPGYEDRYLEIRADSVIFGTGGLASTSHSLHRVEVEEESGGRIRCVLHYQLPEGGSGELRLVHEPGAPPRLRFENRKEIWQREADAGWLAKEGTG